MAAGSETTVAIAVIVAVVGVACVVAAIALFVYRKRRFTLTTKP